MDSRAWQVTVHGVTKSQTWLSTRHMLRHAIGYTCSPESGGECLRSGGRRSPALVVNGAKDSSVINKDLIDGFLQTPCFLLLPLTPPLTFSLLCSRAISSFVSEVFFFFPSPIPLGMLTPEIWAWGCINVLWSCSPALLASPPLPASWALHPAPPASCSGKPFFSPPASLWLWLTLHCFRVSGHRESFEEEG